MTKSMAARSRDAKSGKEVVLQTHYSDAPLLPVEQLERLHQFRPDLIDFFVEQTRLEAERRRNHEKRFNHHVFIERMSGITCALLIGLLGLITGAYVGLQGQPWLGGTMVTVSLGTLAVAFLTRNKNKAQQ